MTKPMPVKPTTPESPATPPSPLQEGEQQPSPQGDAYAGDYSDQASPASSESMETDRFENSCAA